MNLTVVDEFEVVRAEGQNEPFPAGSVSKSVAAYAALRLVDCGGLDLDQDVSRSTFEQRDCARHRSLYGSDEGGRGLVLATRGGATPEFFADLLGLSTSAAGAN